MNGQQTYKGMEEAAKAMGAGAWALATAHYFTNEVDPGAGAAESDFEEATFNGGASSALGAFGPPYRNGANEAVVEAPAKTVTTDGVIPETVFGVYFKGAGTGTPLLGYALFDTPVTMDAPDKGFTMAVQLVVSSTMAAPRVYVI